MSDQMYERLVKEYPASPFSQQGQAMLKVKEQRLEMKRKQIEQQAEAEVRKAEQEKVMKQQEAEQRKNRINEYEQHKKDIAECKKAPCAVLKLRRLGGAYYRYGDYSMALQTFQKMSQESPFPSVVQSAEEQITYIKQLQESERKQAEQQKAQIDQYKKQLAECKGDNCAGIMITLGGAYYQQAKIGGGNYSMAKQTYERLMKEYPNHPFSKAAKSWLTTIEAVETMQKNK
jgi:tetratricopeptide (TPR) repeat protein